MKERIRLKAARIKELLRDIGENQTGLAVHVGMQPGNLSTLMRGVPCSLYTAARLSEALGVSMDEIIEKFDAGPSGKGFKPVTTTAKPKELSEDDQRVADLEEYLATKGL